MIWDFDLNYIGKGMKQAPVVRHFFICVTAGFLHLTDNFNHSLLLDLYS